MISNIEELVEFEKQFMIEDSFLNKKSLITLPGISKDECDRLILKLRNIPESFLSVISSINVNNKSFVGFGFAVGYKESYCDFLIEINTILLDRTIYEYNNKYGLYKIASFDGEHICVVYNDSVFKPGSIVMYFHDELFSPPVLLAKDFESFMLIIANFQNCLCCYDDQKKGKEEFLRVLDYFFPDEGIKNWQYLIDISFEE